MPKDRRGTAIPIAVAVAVALLVAACQSSIGPTPTLAPTTSPAASAGQPSVSSRPTASAPAASAADRVVPDPDLLSVLPSTADGLERTYDPDTTAQVAADPALVADVSALAIALVRKAGAPVDAPDIAVASVVRLRDPAAADDEWFRAWRDTYDDSACAQAGGVTGHAQADITGRTVFIGTCGGGANTYHVRLAPGAIVISITSVGPARLGQTVMERLKP